MSFEDDEYWEDEYSEYSLVPNAAVVQEKKYERRTAPDPVMPTRRHPDEDEDNGPVDELAARRKRRAAGTDPFDASRPSWLDDPGFVPIDTSRPNLAGHAYDGVDFNRPELGADFDSPEFPISGIPARRREDAYGKYPDDIDQPFDHRDLQAYGHGRTGTVWSSEEGSRSTADNESPAARAARPHERPGRPGSTEETGRGGQPGRSGRPTEAGRPGRPGSSAERPGRPGRNGRPERPRVAEYDYDWAAEDTPGTAGRRPADSQWPVDAQRPSWDEVTGEVVAVDRRFAPADDRPQRPESRPGRAGADERRGGRPEEQAGRVDEQAGRVDERRGGRPDERVARIDEGRGRRPGARPDERRGGDIDPRRAGRPEEQVARPDERAAQARGRAEQPAARTEEKRGWLRFGRGKRHDETPAARVDQQQPDVRPEEWAPQPQPQAGRPDERRDDRRRTRPEDVPAARGGQRGPVAEGRARVANFDLDFQPVDGRNDTWADTSGAERDSEEAAAVRGPDENRDDARGSMPEPGPPRVVATATPSSPPRVISKATPPTQPRVVKKVESVETPRVVATTPPNPAARLVPTPPVQAVPPAAAAPASPDGVPHGGTTGPKVVRPDNPAAQGQAPQTGYSGQPGQPNYPRQPGYSTQPGYSGQPGQAAQAGYPGQPTQTGRPAQPPQTGHPAPPGHAGRPGRAPQQTQTGSPTPPGQQPQPRRTGQNGQPGRATQPHPRPTGPMADQQRMAAPGGPLSEADARAAGQLPHRPMPTPGESGSFAGPGQMRPRPTPTPSESGSFAGPGQMPTRPMPTPGESGSFAGPGEMPPRQRRSPRTAHVHLSQDDGPWSMVPDDAPPAAVPISGLSRAISPAGPETADGRPVSPAAAGGHPATTDPRMFAPAQHDGRPVSPAAANYPPPPDTRPGGPTTDDIRPASPAAGAHHAAPPAPPAPPRPAEIRPAPAKVRPAPPENRPAPPENRPTPPEVRPTPPENWPARGSHAMPTGAWPIVPGLGGHRSDDDVPGRSKPENKPTPAAPPVTDLPTRPLDGEAGTPPAAGPTAGRRPEQVPEGSVARPMSLGDTLPIVPAAPRPTPENAQPTPENAQPGRENVQLPETARPTPEHLGPAPESRADRPRVGPAPATAARQAGAVENLLDSSTPAGVEESRTPAATGDARAQHLGDGSGRAPAQRTGEEAMPGQAGGNGGARHQSGEIATDAVAGAPRMGAHAAPYMDAHGVLHNLKPIGRLPVSGPDVEPRRGESAFGSLWFTAEEESEASAPEELPTRMRVRPDGDDHVVIDLDLTGLLGGMSLPADEADTAPDQPQDQQAQDQQAQDARPEWPPTQPPSQPPTQPPVEKPQPPVEKAPSEGTEEQTPTGSTNGQPAADTAVVPANTATAGARRNSTTPAPLSLIPGPEPVLEKAQPKRPAPERRALTAADLQAIRWRLDGGTLREVVDDKAALRELGEKLDEPLAKESDTVAKAGLLSVRAEVYRLLGELGMAAAASRLALAHAESARDLQSMVIAQAELAHVLRLRGDFVEADRLFGRAANAQVPAPLRSVVHENAGRCCFDQGRYMEALDHFARAVRLGGPDDTDLAERIGVCLEAVYIHVLRDGWGPYPRRSLDSLGVSAPAEPNGFNETTAEQPTVQPR